MKEGTNKSFIIYQTSFLVSFYSCLLISHDGYKSPRLGVLYGLLKDYLIEFH